MRSLLCLIVSRAHTWRTLRPDFRWVESTFGNTNRLESSRFESIRQNFSPPCAFIRDLTSGKSSSAKRTSGESEVFDPRADSNRLCFKTIRLSLGVLDMSDTIPLVSTWVLLLNYRLVRSQASSFSVVYNWNKHTFSDADNNNFPA